MDHDSIHSAKEKFENHLTFNLFLRLGCSYVLSYQTV